MVVRKIPFIGGAFALLFTLAGCSTYSGVVNQPGPDTPVSDLRRDPAGEIRLASAPHPFCPAPEAMTAEQLASLKVLLYFHHDTNILTDASRQEAERFYREVIDRYASEVFITGYTDTSGSDAYNLALSQRRAERVKTEMIGIGVDPDIITTRARGEQELLIQTPDNVREPKNRRVEITVR